MYEAAAGVAVRPPVGRSHEIGVRVALRVGKGRIGRWAQCCAGARALPARGRRARVGVVADGVRREVEVALKALLELKLYRITSILGRDGLADAISGSHDGRLVAAVVVNGHVPIRIAEGA